MRKQILLSSLSLIIISLSSFSLIAATSIPKEFLTPQIFEEESASLFSDAENLEQYNTLMDGTEIIADSTKSDLDLPFEESDLNIEDQDPSEATSSLKPDVHKVLYNPNMNYGTGAPVPKAEPITTAKRNLIVLGTSTILATIAMLVVSSNKGLDAPKKH